MQERSRNETLKCMILGSQTSRATLKKQQALHQQWTVWAPLRRVLLGMLSRILKLGRILEQLNLDILLFVVSFAHSRLDDTTLGY